jgi:hypothetical protein
MNTALELPTQRRLANFSRYKRSVAYLYKLWEVISTLSEGCLEVLELASLALDSISNAYTTVKELSHLCVVLRQSICILVSVITQQTD